MVYGSSWLLVGAELTFVNLGHAEQSARLDDPSQPTAGSDAPLAPRRALPPPSDRPPASVSETEARGRNLPEDVPLVAYATNAFGADPSSLGVSGFAETRGSQQSTKALANGGLRVWGAPIDRLVLVLDAQRREENNAFAPSVTAQVRLLGSTRDGWALGVLSRYKTEGFAELGGEVEGGVLLSVKSLGFHLDSNLIGGGDFDGGESDGEALARAGYDVTSFLRLGGEARGRYRLSGSKPLPGNRSADVFGGAQALAYADHYFAAVTGGPSTVGISDRIGWSIIVNAGGVAF
ncbi:MAG TPA: hypothetical protein VGI10_25570 [Polyangiaceae bacterium]